MEYGYGSSRYLMSLVTRCSLSVGAARPGALLDLPIQFLSLKPITPSPLGALRVGRQGACRARHQPAPD